MRDCPLYEAQEMFTGKEIEDLNADWAIDIAGDASDPHDAQHHQMMALYEEFERLRSLLRRVPHVHWDRYAGNCESGCLRCEIDRELKKA